MATLFWLRKFRAFQALTTWLDWPVAVKLPGYPFRVTLRLGPNISLALASTSAEKNERRFFAQVIDRLSAKSLWDVGANIGLYGFAFAVQQGKSSRVLLIEPDPANLFCLEATKKRSRLSGIEILDVAVGASRGEAVFLRDHLTGATGQLAGLPKASFIARHHGARTKVIKVAQIALDDLLAAHGQPDVVKIDIEGAEGAALTGATALLERARPFIFLEMSHPLNLCADLLASKGYKLYDWRSGKAAPAGSFMALAVPVEKRAELGDLVED